MSYQTNYSRDGACNIVESQEIRESQKQIESQMMSMCELMETANKRIDNMHTDMNIFANIMKDFGTQFTELKSIVLYLKQSPPDPDDPSEPMNIELPSAESGMDR